MHGSHSRPFVLPLTEGAAVPSNSNSQAGLLEYPHYTKPREWEGRAIPEVLLSGDHKKIAEWRRAEAARITAQRRPDLVPRPKREPKA